MGAGRSRRLRAIWPLLAGIAIFFVVLIFVFPLVFSPGVQPPGNMQFTSPFAVTIEISNLNATPITDARYSCTASEVKLKTGDVAPQPAVLTQGTIRKLPGRHAAAVRCETGYLLDAPLQALEYTLTLTYRANPWPQPRTKVYRIRAEIDAKGEVTGWKVA